MPPPSRLTPKQWQELVEYYQSGRTLEECGRIYGLTGQYIGIKLKKMGVKARERFEPSRPEKWEKAPPHTKAMNPLPVEKPEEEDLLHDRIHKELGQARIGKTVKIRKIVSLNGESHTTYEKDYKGENNER